MYRNVINDLSIWYEEPKRKILSVKGALGVGKTWAVKDFTFAFFDQQRYIDFAEDNTFYNIITRIQYPNADVPAVLKSFDDALEKFFGEKDFSEAVLIFDGMENTPEYPRFFYEYAKKHRNYTICLIASSMEIDEFEYSHPDVFKIIRMRPMSFEEYMIANKAKPFLTAIENHKRSPLSSLEAKAISTMLKEYMMVGGMPAAVKEYIKTKDYSKVRAIQENIIEDYMKLLKNSLSNSLAGRCRRILNNIPKQLANDNKKFMYKSVDSNARSREYAEAVQTLCDLGLTRKLPRLISSEFPLEDNVDFKSFELFYIDHGLLRASYKLPMGDDVELRSIFEEQNNAIAEQYVFQELSNKLGNIYYWISGATARVPFIYEADNSVVPVVVQLDENNKAQNIKTFCAKNSNIDIAIRISLDQVSYDKNTLNLPAYGIWNM